MRELLNAEGEDSESTLATEPRTAKTHTRSHRASAIHLAPTQPG
jgi:hypothetical protein